MAIELSWPILGVIIPSILISVGGYGTYFYILSPHHDSPWQLRWFQFSLAMTWLSYFLAIKVDAGSPPRSFQFTPKEWKRWCIKCNNYKPERSHHCRQCGKCVLKMDHHCPWTYNCVGNNNLPHFIRFLLWVNISCIYALYHLFIRAVALFKSRHLPAYLVPKSEIVATVVLIPIVGFVLLSVGMLTIRVFVNIFNGQTQIEVWETERIESLVRRRLVPHVEFPYDIDPWTNLVTAWGPIYTWALPWSGPGTNGLHFEKNEVGDDDEAVWPPDHRDQHPPTLEEQQHQQQLSMTSHAQTLGYQTSSRTSSPALQPEAPAEFRRHRLPPRESSINPSYPRQNREEDFFRSDQWQNYDGERISDFGVDIDTVASSVAPQHYMMMSPREPPAARGDYSSSDDNDDDVPLARLVN